MAPTLSLVRRLKSREIRLERHTASAVLLGPTHLIGNVLEGVIQICQRLDANLAIKTVSTGTVDTLLRRHHRRLS